MFICIACPSWHSGKESACQCKRLRFDSWVEEVLWRRKWQPTPVFLPEKSQEQRSLAGYSPRSCKRVGHDLATKQQTYILMRTPLLPSWCSDNTCFEPNEHYGGIKIKQLCMKKSYLPSSPNTLLDMPACTFPF